MTAPTYLYSFGRRRHIADPARGWQSRHPESLTVAYCGGWFETEAHLKADHQWDPALSDAEIARKKNEPVCKLCQRAYDKQTAT